MQKRKDAKFVLATQLLTSFADGALMFLVIGALKSDGYGAATIPAMSAAFLGTLLALAPFVGPLSDTFPKNRVLIASIAIKLAAAVSMIIIESPILAYAISGVAAALHHTVKWAILPELANGHELVKLNGSNEIVSFLGTLSGTLAGGILSDTDPNSGIHLVAAINAVALSWAFFVSRMPISNPSERLDPVSLLRDFKSSLAFALKGKTTRFTLSGTSIYSCIVSATKDILIVWVPISLFIHDNSTPATFATIMTLGIVCGAVLIKNIPHHFIPKTIFLGMVPGSVLITMHFVMNPYAIGALIFISGVCAGTFKIPINTIAQIKSAGGHGSGRGMAVQSFAQNGSILSLQGIWMIALMLDKTGGMIAPIFGTILFFGAAIIAAKRPHNEKISAMLAPTKNGRVQTPTPKGGG